jgi:flagellar biosynthesis protein
VAEAILAAAREHNIPIEENPALAAALSQVEIDTEIPEELYRAVAEVLGFVLRTAGKIK